MMARQIVGIDISKATFDAAWRIGDASGWHQFHGQQEPDAYTSLLEAAPPGAVFVMEATGVYALRLAHWLYAHGQKVMVVNPLVIKRFTQMHLIRAKTDRVDAQQIARYGGQTQGPLWRPREAIFTELNQLDSWLDDLLRQRTRVANQGEALRHCPDASPLALQQQQALIDYLSQQIATVEMAMQALVESCAGELYQRLLSIPGVGPKTAIRLIGVTEGFTRFTTVKQLVSYVGLSPHPYESGTSIKGKGHLAKYGMGRMRQLLYLCSWTARRSNPGCAVLYKRLKAQGKPERVIKCAVAHKLVRQAYAIATRGGMFDPEKA
jgi:transposase